MKYFISQPMNGRSNNEIKEEREEIIKGIMASDADAEIIESFFENAPINLSPLKLLGMSIEKMADADVAYFVKGWEKARGCVIENKCAFAYDMVVIEETEEDL